MEKRKRLVLLFSALLVTGILMDLTEKRIGKDLRIRRQDAGGDTEQYELMLGAEDVLKDYPYTISVPPQVPDEGEILGLLENAKKEIDESFCEAGQTLSGVSDQVHPQERYANDLVSAVWAYEPEGIVDENGRLKESLIPAEGCMVTVQASLSCYDKKEIYEFSFFALQGTRSRQEILLGEIAKDIGSQMKEAGKQYITLPGQIGGTKILWQSPKSHYTRNILLLEAGMAVGLLLLRRERRREEGKRLRREMELDYPSIVSKLLLLTGAGMSLGMAWNKIAASYEDARKNYDIVQRPAYELMVVYARKMRDGVSERTALRQFAEETGCSSYQRLCRLLTEMLQKGAHGMEQQMEAEAAQAFSVRKNAARRLGEEAGTKLLLPMILMLGVVMAVIMVPAMTSL